MQDGRRRMTQLAKTASRSRIRSSSGVRCTVCGWKGPALVVPTVSPGLRAAWGLDEHWTRLVNEREGLLCLGCRSSRRTAQMAEALLALAHEEGLSEATTLRALVDDPRVHALEVAELNSCGSLHRYLRRLPRLQYSEYGSTDPHVPSQDLMALTYADRSFDVVLTSDTLEHVPDFAAANREILRVLKPGGLHVFTVPIIPDGRPTRRRAQLVEDGSLIRLRPDSFHGRPGEERLDFLVFHEFGLDVLADIEGFGFECRTHQDTANPALVAVIARKPSAG